MPFCQGLYDKGDTESGVKTIGGNQVYCDMSLSVGGKAWTLLMTVASDSGFEYNNNVWTEDNTFNVDNPSVAGVNAKYASFNTMSVTQLRLDNLDLGPRP